MEVPKEKNNLICPISMDLMTDPVVAACGHVFDKESIEKYFNRTNLKK